jgi:glucose/arabinose dehydrogenase
MLRASWLVLALASMVCTTPKDDAPDVSAQNTSNDVRLGVEQVASGLDQPVYLTAPVSDPRLFIVEQPGRIRVWRTADFSTSRSSTSSTRSDPGENRGC